MLKVQPYNTQSQNINLKSTCSLRGKKDMLQISPKIYASMQDLISQDKTYQSKRFIDGSFLEVQRENTIDFLIRLMQINKKPISMNVGSNGSVESKNNGLIEKVQKYLLNILEEEQVKDI